MQKEQMQKDMQEYLKLSKEIQEERKKQAEKKKNLMNLEETIFKYMEEQNMDSIVLNNGEIILYDRKVSQTYKKDTIAKCLKERKIEASLADTLAESITTNKVFNTEKKIKAKLKKN